MKKRLGTSNQATRSNDSTKTGQLRGLQHASSSNIF